MTKEQKIEKLKKIKALAERGIGGEKTGAIELYEKLLKKYEMADNEISADENIEIRWFKYKNDLEAKLLIQIFYKVTGSSEYWYKKDKRRHLKGVECTEIEAEEINFYFEIYKEELSQQLAMFVEAFIRKNDIYPDKTTRVQESHNINILPSEEELERDIRIDQIASGIKETEIYKIYKYKQIETT